MDTQSEIRVLTAKERADLRWLASQATPGPWKVWHTGHVYTGPDKTPLHTVWLLKDNCRYIAAVSPDITLATLSYVEALEAEVARLTDSTGSQHVHDARIDRHLTDNATLKASLAEAVEHGKAGWGRATKAEARVAELQGELAEQEREKLALIRAAQPLPFPANEPAAAYEQYFCQAGDDVCLLMWLSKWDAFEEVGTETGTWAEWDGDTYIPTQHAVSAFWPHPKAAPTPPPSSPAAAGPELKPFHLAAFGYEGDEREVIGTYETSGLPVYEGDDYVTDVEGCYLTRVEADELKAEDEKRAPATTTGEAQRDASTPCTCSFLAQTVGDGCWKCNPECFEDEPDATTGEGKEGHNGPKRDWHQWIKLAQGIAHTYPRYTDSVKVKDAAGHEAFASWANGHWAFRLGEKSLEVVEWRELASK